MANAPAATMREKARKVAPKLIDLTEKFYLAMSGSAQVYPSGTAASLPWRPSCPPIVPNNSARISSAPWTTASPRKKSES